jgi:hypothetical protein
MQYLAQPRRKRNRVADGILRSLYDGQDRLGHIVDDECGFIAYGRLRNRLGCYPTSKAAAAAVYAQDAQRKSPQTLPKANKAVPQ